MSTARSDVKLEPVSGIEPLTCRLQVWRRSTGGEASALPVAAASAHPGPPSSGALLHGWLQHEPTVLRTAIHAHDLRSLTCRYFSGRLPTADGVPSRFRQHPNTL